MPLMFLTTPGTRASLISERLHIETPPQNGADPPASRDIPLIEIEQIVIHETVQITNATAAQQQILARTRPVSGAYNLASLPVIFRVSRHTGPARRLAD